MKNLTITLTEEVANIVDVSEIKNMLKAVDAKIYMEELHVDMARFTLLLQKARAVEATKNRVVQTWEIAFGATFESVLFPKK